MKIISGIKHNYELQKSEGDSARHKTTFGKMLSSVHNGHRQMKLDNMTTVQQLSEFVGKQKLTSQNKIKIQAKYTGNELATNSDKNRREMGAKQINTNNIDNLLDKMKAGYVINNDDIITSPMRNPPVFHMDDLVTLATKGSIDGGRTAERKPAREYNINKSAEGVKFTEARGASYESFRSGSESQAAASLINDFLHSERSPRITDVSALNMNSEEFSQYMNNKMENLREEDRVLAKVLFHELGKLSKDGNAFIRDIRSVMFGQNAVDSKVRDHITSISSNFHLSDTASIATEHELNAATAIIKTLGQKLIDYAQTVKDPRTTNVV